MTDEEFQWALSTVCQNTSWTWMRQEGMFHLWQCTVCGYVARDTLSISGATIFGPHFRRKPEPVPQAFYRAFEDT